MITCAVTDTPRSIPYVASKAMHPLLLRLDKLALQELLDSLRSVIFLCLPDQRVLLVIDSHFDLAVIFLLLFRHLLLLWYLSNRFAVS